MLRSTGEHKKQHRHRIHDATTHLQLFNDFKQLRVLTWTKVSWGQAATQGKRKRKAEKEQDKTLMQRKLDSYENMAWKYISYIKLRQSRWWIHLLVAAGSDERLAVSGRRVQDVQYSVFCHSFSPAATGSFKRDHAICSPAAAKGCQLTGKCSNKTENRASPRLIPMCESVHAVKKKGSTKLKKKTHFTETRLLTILFSSSHCCATDWLWKILKLEIAVSAFTHPPYAPKVKLLFLENDMSFLLSLSLASAWLWMFVHDSLRLSQSGLAQVKLIHSIILPLLLLLLRAPYLSL